MSFKFRKIVVVDGDLEYLLVAKEEVLAILMWSCGKIHARKSGPLNVLTPCVVDSDMTDEEDNPLRWEVEHSVTGQVLQLPLKMYRCCNNLIFHNVPQDHWYDPLYGMVFCFGLGCFGAPNAFDNPFLFNKEELVAVRECIRADFWSRVAAAIASRGG